MRPNRYRRSLRTCLRRPVRRGYRSALRGRRSGPDDFAQMLAAYARAVRIHRRLARLAPAFFDAAVMERQRENRAEQRRWLALWEPALAQAYGVAPEPVVLDESLPPLPAPATQRTVDRLLVELPLWWAAAQAARERYQQRRPHALPSWSRLARLLQLAFDLKKLCLGLDSPNPLPEKIIYDDTLADLQRAYGHLVDPAPAPAASPKPPPPPEPTVDVAVSLKPSVIVASVTALPEPSRCDAYSRLARQSRRILG